MKVLPPTHPAAVPVDIGQSSRPHDDVVDGVALSLQGTENKDAHGGIELQLRPRLDGEGGVRHHREVAAYHVRSAGAGEKADGFVQPATEVIEV